MGSFLTVIGVGYALVVGGLFVIQRSLLYFPSDNVPVPAETLVPEMAVVSLTTADGLELDSWYAPAAVGRPTIVYFCGNGGHIGMRDAKVRAYLDAGFGVLLVGYRGYGDNPGSPSERGLYSDGRAALGFMRENGVAPRMRVLYGESLGSGVAVQLAIEQSGAGDPVGAVVLEAPFTSVGAVAQAHYPFVPARWIVRDRFDSVSKIARVGSPVYIVHGEGDRIVPVRYGRRLFAAAAEPKEMRIVGGAGHNDLYDFDVPEGVIAFLDRTFRD
ncbi:MAG: alpha/beta hydrolase [Rhodospirillales bacterium]|jgi:hypothetical protein|nr:alpha/beta hydrolase [Rhodospirillales bacterium]